MHNSYSKQRKEKVSIQCLFSYVSLCWTQKPFLSFSIFTTEQILNLNDTG